MSKLFAEDCTWSSDIGFQHQYFCGHTCHNGPSISHIFKCCNREILTNSILCSARCARPRDKPEDLVPAPDCPHCGPWTEESELLYALEGIEFWFQFFTLVPHDAQTSHQLTQLRAFQAEQIRGAGERWVQFFQETGSVVALRQALVEHCEEQKDTLSVSSNRSWDSFEHQALCITEEEAENWYAGSNGRMYRKVPSALDQFLQDRQGALTFATGPCDEDGTLRMSMIERLKEARSHVGNEEPDEITQRRLVSLLDRELCEHYILRSPRRDLLEADKQMIIYRAEQLLQQNARYYWKDINALVDPGLEIWKLTYDELLLQDIAWLPGSQTMDTIEPVLAWLARSQEDGVRFRSGTGRFGRFTRVSAISLLAKYEAEFFGCLTNWSSSLVAGFVCGIAEMLQLKDADITPWSQTQDRVKELEEELMDIATADCESIL